MHLHAKVKALAHFTRNCKKCSYCPYTLQLFSQLQRYFQQFFYMSNNFCNRHFSKNLCSFVCSVRGRDVVYTKFGCLPVNNSEEVERSRWQAYTHTHVFDESRWRANRNVQNFAISKNRQDAATYVIKQM